MEQMVLDYADFVELACEEEAEGVYGSWPSELDVLRSAPRFVVENPNPCDQYWLSTIGESHLGRMLTDKDHYVSISLKLFGVRY